MLVHCFLYLEHDKKFKKLFTLLKRRLPTGGKFLLTSKLLTEKNLHAARVCGFAHISAFLFFSEKV